MAHRFCINGSVYFILILWLLLLPVKWVCGAVLAAFIHESFHLTAIFLLHGDVREIYISPTGAVIDMYPLSNGKEFLCALAGPVGSFSLMILGSVFPELAVCGLIQGAYNLLPVYPLDGGRMLRCLLNSWMPVQAEKLSDAITAATSLFLIVYSIIYRFWPAFIPLTTVIRWSLRKIPCKEGNLAVQ